MLFSIYCLIWGVAEVVFTESVVYFHFLFWNPAGINIRLALNAFFFRCTLTCRELKLILLSSLKKKQRKSTP